MRLFSLLNKEISLISFIGLVGLGLRWQQYSANRSLWLDEALLSLNLINRSFEQLLGPLDNEQGAPIGFLWVVKWMITQFGTSEYALRLFPLMSGLLAGLIFYPLARQYVTMAAARWAYLLFMLSGPLIYYSAEVKQYSSDILFSLVALSLFFWLKKPHGAYIILAGLGGLILSWFSHPVIFILATNGLLALAFWLQQKNYRYAVLMCFIGLAWLASLWLNYIVSLQYLTQNQLLNTYWQNGFAPSLTQPMVWGIWLMDSWVRLFRNTLGFSFAGLAFLGYGVGVITVYKEKKWLGSQLFLPLLLVFGAAIVHIYPFGDRLLLFALPMLFLAIGAGIDRLHQLFQAAQLPMISGLLFALFLYQPLLDTSRFIYEPQLREEVRPVMDYMSLSWQTGDIIYVYYATDKPFHYYLPRYPFSSKDYVIGTAGRNDWSKYIYDISQMKQHRRVWFLFSHVYQGSGASEELLFLSYLDNSGGVLKDKLQVTGAAVYLYEFP